MNQSSPPPTPLPHEPDLALAQRLGLKSAFVPDDQQQHAIDTCCDVSKRIVAVTGKAGTGKTSIIKQVHKYLQDAGYIISVSAPTGKAAKRVQETTGIHAMTNHRLLGYGMPIDVEEEDRKTGEKKLVKISSGPSFNRRRPLADDVIICDEYAMVNHEIHDNLLAALKGGARMLYFGDVNQLRPIEENKKLAEEASPFMKLLTKFNGIELNINHRQAEGSGIHENAERILKGMMPQRRDDFGITYSDDPIKAIKVLVDEAKEQDRRFDTPSCQIVTCMNKSWIGTAKLNLTIQSMYWERERPGMDLPRHKWINDGGEIRVQVGSKVVYTTNSYDLGEGQSAFNGEVGTVIEINHTEGTLDVDFGDRVVRFPPYLVIVYSDGRAVETDPRRNIDLAYVLTTHKMQGSECDEIVYMLNKSTTYVQSRRNFYTAVTRAQKRCTVITDTLSINKSVKFMG